MTMASPSNQCLRLLRQGLRKEAQTRPHNACSRLARSEPCRRSFETASPRPQQPPTTSGTLTSNVSTEPPPPSSPGAGDLSTREMQRQIIHGLKSSTDLTAKLAQNLQKRGSGTAQTYITYGLTQSLFNTCSAQASYTIPEKQRMGILTGTGPPKTASGEDIGVPVPETIISSSFWFDDLGMRPTFSTWSQVSYLHMYLLTVRLRAVDSPAVFQNYQRYLLEHFSNTAEDKMNILHGMSARGIRNRYLKDLFLQWRGLLAAYDEGLIKGDAVLAGAVWRNMFKGDEEVDWTKVAVVIAYMRRVTTMLAKVEVRELAQSISGREGVFEVARKDLFRVVDKSSRGIDEDFGPED